MVELQQINLSSYRKNELSGLLSLMQIQNNYIAQVYRMIFALYTESSVSSNMEFQEFTAHFNMFVQYQAGGEGFVKAMDAVQVYYFAVLEKLLDAQVLPAAEQLELSVGHLELAAREPQIRANPSVVMLSHGIEYLEETELKIIEHLEAVLENYRQFQLQN